MSDKFDEERRQDRIDELQERAERAEIYEEALQRVVRWSEAYPTTVFPEPDLIKVAEVLKASGMTLDSVSAHCMRHCLASVGQIAKEALDGNAGSG